MQRTYVQLLQAQTNENATLLRTENLVYLRDGDVVLYKRERSRVWQMRYKLFDKEWRRVSTKHRNLNYAIKVAGDIYDEARFRERLGITHTTKKFHAIAKVCLQDLENEINAGIKPLTNKDYIRAINKYLIPFFGNYLLENIDGEVMRKYELWRNELMGKVPLTSTLANHASAYRRVIDTAIQRGWINDNTPIASMSRRGVKGKPRPGFTREEIDFLLNYLKTYSVGGHSGVAKEMRLLSRDYIELLIGTGMRCGKESLNIRWKHITWYTDSNTGKRYLRIWVTGKTGARYLIAKHNVKEALDRLLSREALFDGKTLDEVLNEKHDLPLFKFKDGTQPKSFHTTFIWLMKASGLLKDSATGQNRTLYSLRHTYATLELIENKTDVHTLAKQMGTSIGMIEKHYSKLTATMAAEKLA
ncbi:tyrosine-type recombinase/integrase [Polynucleobacter sp. AP-RePozz3-80-G7]|uniref:tyrosine-type recombinase/integrase n=1 Tax=Polynucleobacter sp. AP-RePozz3-80-G7 TaxID=2689105 RepID=UPI001C0B6E57|nr:tyrosine-type recombinase/integrase [Polynucleobacter sp. AP-RePozz3-80-G7]MBU3638189.1 tyrosine-type recombinase/integrase [Polynucleobacter sp. AP-RePozz3-80-G7]